MIVIKYHDIKITIKIKTYNNLSFLYENLLKIIRIYKNINELIILVKMKIKTKNK